MSLIDDIQVSAIDSKTDIGTLLRRCRLLAAKLDNKPLEDWIVWELNGYPLEAPVPDYRIFPLELKGNFVGAFGRELRNAPIPSFIIPEDVRDTFTSYKYRESISTIEELLNADKSNIFRFSTGDLAPLLGQTVYNGLNCLQCWLEGSRGSLIEAVNAVRNRTLEFAIELQKKYPLIDESSNRGDNTQNAAINHIFNTTIYGGEAKIVGSAENSIINFTNSTANFEELSMILKNNGIKADDIAKLQNAIQEDPPPTEINRYGKHVSKWIASMLEKSASGVWNIAIGTAANLLSQVIAKYYGL